MDKEGFSVAMHFDMFGASMANAERWWGAGESDTQPGVFLRVISPSGTTSILRMQVEDDAGVQERINTSEAMEMGAAAVLVNTAIAVAGDPVAMAGAFRAAVEAGRTAFGAGLPTQSERAEATSPLTGFLDE